MKQSPSRVPNQFLASQEIPRILWNSKVHYLIHKCLPPVLSWASSLQSMPPHPTSSRSILIFILPSRRGSSKGSLSLRFPHQNPVYACLVAHGFANISAPPDIPTSNYRRYFYKCLTSWVYGTEANEEMWRYAYVPLNYKISQFAFPVHNNTAKRADFSQFFYFSC
jgi:hypothetical protein